MKRVLIAMSILVLLTAACAQARQEVAPVSRSQSEAGAPPQEPSGAVSNPSYSEQVPDVKRLVITNASISLAVADPEASLNKIAALATEMGGFVVTSRLSQVRLESGQEVPQGSITIRVPAEKLSEALQRIRSESTRKPISESSESQDVTKDYTDLGSRLRNLEAAEAQLQKIMEATNDTENVLRVYNELKSVREQIEVIKGQIQYYEQSAALSAISIELNANESIQPLSIGGWQPVGVARNALQALISGVKVLFNIGIWVVLFMLPMLVLIGLPFYVLFRLLRRRGKAKPQPSAPARQ